MVEDSDKLVLLNFKTGLIALLLFSITTWTNGQTIDTLVNKALKVEVTLNNACNKTKNNGSISFRLLGTESNKATVLFLIGDAPLVFKDLIPKSLEIGGTDVFTYTNLKPGNYDFGVVDTENDSLDIISVNGDFAKLTIKAPIEFPTLSFQIQPSTCKNSNDATITVNQTGGTGTYQYSKDNGTLFQSSSVFDKLSAGTYTIVLKDELDCRYGPETKTVTEPDSVSITTTFKNPVCNKNTNGEISVTATGGNGTFQYSITNGTTYGTASTFKDLKDGVYPVIVKDVKGCLSATKTIILVSPPVITFTFTITEETCANTKDGAINLTASGGSGSFTYSSNGGVTFVASNLFSGLTAGTYTLVVKDNNNCISAPQSVILKPKPIILINATKTEITTCIPGNDGKLSVTASQGTAPYEFSIDNGTTFSQTASFTGLPPAVYAVIAKDAAGCTSLPSPQEFKIPEIKQTIKQKGITCNGNNDGQIEIQVAGGNGTYQYSIDNGSTLQASPIFGPLAPSQLQVVTKDGAGCISAVENIDFKEPAVLDFTSNLTNAGCLNNGVIEINGITGGTKPYSFRFNNLPVIILTEKYTFSNLSKGNYAFEMKDVNGCTKTATFELQQPPAIQATADVIGPNCAGDGLNGKITVKLISEGTFETGITTSLTTPPTQFFPISSTNNTFEFKNLTRGGYYAIVRGGSLCDAILPLIISGGPDPITFSYQNKNKKCFEDQGSVVVSGMKGGINLPFTVSITKGNTNVISQFISFDQSKGNVEFKVTDNGDYNIVVTQNQSTINGCLNIIKSPTFKFTIEGPSAKLDTVGIIKTTSFTDAPSGKVIGNISPSGYEPYESSLELIDPEFSGQSFFADFSTINKNPETGLFEYNYEDLFAGTYNLSLRDN
ncbi:MAG: SprB repeat-containing protein [Bacteroidetes bacterium]|nr:SprB repeat-containing protein [Bacteroidota bacterium]